MPRGSTASLLAVLLLTLAVLVTGCSGTRLTVASDVGDFDASNVNGIADEVKTPSWFGVPLSEAPDLRHEALVELRSSSGDGAELADLLTDEFPSEIRSAPYYTGSGTFNGIDAWFILEIWGSEGGTLDQTRLWVFDRETHHVLYTGAIN